MSHMETLEYYNTNAVNFVHGTINVDFGETQERFLKHIPPRGRILDFGCGSGRDAKHFHVRGFEVDAVDGSEELYKLACEYTGLNVKQMLFSDLDMVEEYDGIWACASILHLPSSELSDVLSKMIKALKNGGIVYASFKYGEYEGMRNGRYFTDFTETSFKKFIADIANIKIIDLWITGDVRPGRGDEKWLNLILQKSDIP
ncbi:MAG: class I SAM-dependent methyltransferase [Lachnospiraceae bacterium]|nr:class I SAM-dependent methyltransferase [Lachnospiraceae bacterium]